MNNSFNIFFFIKLKRNVIGFFVFFTFQLLILFIDIDFDYKNVRLCCLIRAHSYVTANILMLYVLGIEKGLFGINN